MNASTSTLRWLYLIVALLLAHQALTSVRAGAWWDAAALFSASLLLGTALIREYIAADERRAAAVRAERAARLRAQRDDVVLGWADLERTCCLRAWGSRGIEHDPRHCSRKDQTA